MTAFPAPRHFPLLYTEEMIAHAYACVSTIIRREHDEQAYPEHELDGMMAEFIARNKLAVARSRELGRLPPLPPMRSASDILASAKQHMQAVADIDDLHMGANALAALFSGLVSSDGQLTVPDAIVACLTSWLSMALGQITHSLLEERAGSAGFIVGPLPGPLRLN